MRVIFSFTDTDPDDITGLSYHGNENRGTKSLILRSHNEGSQSLPEDSVSMDILVTEVRMSDFVSPGFLRFHDSFEAHR